MPSAAIIAATGREREKEECTENWQDTPTCHARCEQWVYASSTPIDTWHHEVTRQLVNECIEVPYQTTTAVEGTAAANLSFDLVVVGIVMGLSWLATR